VRRSLLTVAAMVLLAGTARADEGFWTFDHFPRQRVRQRYGVEVDDQVLAHVARAAINFHGSTGALVSPRGLVAIKHGTLKTTCLHALREGRRTAGRFASWCQDQALRQAVPLFDRLYCRPLERAVEYDYVERGYLAATPRDELRCPNLSVSSLLDVSDVTGRVRAAMARAAPDKRPAAELEVVREIERECEGEAGIRCAVASLHGGTRYQLHRSRRYDDVRLVFASERRAADYGDVPDEMTYPDHDFKTAFVRVYQDGRPASTPTYLRFSTRLPREGELTLMAGHPRESLRHGLASQVQRQHDFTEAALENELEQRGLLSAIAAQRPALAPAFDFDDRNDGIVERESLLHNLPLDAMEKRVQDQRRLLETLRARSDPQLPAIERALAESAAADALHRAVRSRALAVSAVARATALDLALAAVAMSKRPELQRLRDELLIPRRFDEEVEIGQMELVFRQLQQACFADDPLLVKLLAGLSARERATTLVRSTRIGDPTFRRKLAEGGRSAVEASTDPLVVLARGFYDEAVATFDRWKAADEKDGVAADLLAAARYRLYGDEEYPEGTGTVRLSFGALAGYRDGNRDIAPVTTLGDLFALSRDSGPYRLPDRWRAARGQLDLSTPLNVATNHDISDSAILLDTNGDLLGVAFNTNRYLVPETYDARLARHVAVHNAAVVQVLRHVYHATALLEELGVATSPARR
jgi:hypothetical protein